MAVLTSTTTTHKSAQVPTSTRQQSEPVHRCALELGPAIHHFSSKRNSALSIRAQPFFHIGRITPTYLLSACSLAALQTLLIVKNFVTMSVAALSRIARNAWDSKPSRRLRKKLEFEFFVLILGGGQNILLLVFWPGWILVGLVYLVYLLCNWAG